MNLKEDELDLLRSVFESISEGVVLVDRDYSIITFNVAFIDLMAIKENGFEGKRCYELIYRRTNPCIPCIPKLYEKTGRGIEKTVLAPEDSWATWIEVREYPLKLKGETIGYIIFIKDVTDKKKVEEKLREQALFDSLTGAYTKKIFMDYLGLLMETSKRYGDPLSLLVMDIDYFKKVNDTYGHVFGDRVLAEIARIVRDNIRRSDIFGRIGGEEFAVILPKTSSDGAILMAERIRKIVSEHLFVHAVRVTISIGITQMEIEDTPESFIMRADEALYEAKRGGRNRVVVM